MKKLLTKSFLGDIKDVQKYVSIFNIYEQKFFVIKTNIHFRLLMGDAELRQQWLTPTLWDAWITPSKTNLTYIKIRLSAPTEFNADMKITSFMINADKKAIFDVTHTPLLMSLVESRRRMTYIKKTYNNND